MANKVSICGIDTTTLPKLSNAELEQLMIKIKQGDKDAKKSLLLQTYGLC